MRCLYGATVIFIIFFRESEASDSNSDKWSSNKSKLSLTKEPKSKARQHRLDIVGTPRHTNPADFSKLRRTLPMDLITQNELAYHQAGPSASPATDLLAQFRAQHPRSRPKSPRKSRRENNPPVDSNLPYQGELGPAPPNPLIMNGEMLSESQVYQMALQRHGKYAPLYPKPPKIPSNSEASGSFFGTAGWGTSEASGYSNTQPDSYFGTEAEREAYRMPGQRHENYSPHRPDPPHFDSHSEHSRAYYGTAGGSTSGASGYPNTQSDLYFGTEAEREAYLMSGQLQGNYDLHHPDSPYFGNDSEHSGSGYHY